MLGFYYRYELHGLERQIAEQGSGESEREREMAAVEDEKRGEEALERLRAADPPLYLSPSPELSQHARDAASHLFFAVLPFCPKSPVDRLLADEGFDAEQIWYQIDLLSRPLLSTMRREVRRLEREPPKVLLPAQGKAEAVKKGEEGEEEEEEEEDDDGEEDEEEEDAAVAEEEEEEEEEEEGEEEEEEEEGEGKGQGVEDRFLKIKELEEYLEKNEEEEYGQPVRRKRKEKKDEEEEEEEDGEEDEEDGEDADEVDLEVRS